VNISGLKVEPADENCFKLLTAVRVEQWLCTA